MDDEQKSVEAKNWTIGKDALMLCIAVDLVLIAILFFRFFDHLGQIEKVMTTIGGAIPPLLYFFRVEMGREKTLPEFLSLRWVKGVVIAYTLLIIVFFIFFLLPIREVVVVTHLDNDPKKGGVVVTWQGKMPKMSDSTGILYLGKVAVGSYEVEYHLDHFLDVKCTVNVGLLPLPVETGYIFKNKDKIVGDLYVQSIPAGAAIWIDKEDKGVLTNNYVSYLTADSHSLVLKKDGYHSKRVLFKINEGELLSLKVELARLTGWILVTSKPSGADVYLNGIHMGNTNTPIRIEHETGEHDLELRMPITDRDGLRSKEKVLIENNTTIKIDKSFDDAYPEDLHPLYIMSKPSADIWVDGKDLGVPTNSGPIYLFEGQHKVTLKIDNNIAKVFTVTIPAVPPVTDTYDLSK